MIRFRDSLVAVTGILQYKSVGINTHSIVLFDVGSIDIIYYRFAPLVFKDIDDGFSVFCFLKDPSGNLVAEIGLLWG